MYGPTSISIIEIWRVSTDVISATHCNQVKNNNLSISDSLPGSYITCLYDGCFIGNVIEVTDQN